MSLDEREIGFRSLTEQIDTTTSCGKPIFHIFDALARFGRSPRERAGHGRLSSCSSVREAG
ncbi:MAG: hypothetical protein ACR2JC_06075 [Chloroflexota bacterium]